MHTWVALLGGVNVGGARKIRMAELRDVCASLGFDPVTTYIQSGNVVFRADDDHPATVAATVSDAIERTFGFGVTTLVERSLCTASTTRNWRTVTTLLEMARGL